MQIVHFLSPDYPTQLLSLYNNGKMMDHLFYPCVYMYEPSLIR
jgi:hypothetical protein